MRNLLYGLLMLALMSAGFADDEVSVQKLTATTSGAFNQLGAPQYVTGLCTIGNQTEQDLRDIEIQIRLRDGYGQDVPGAVVVRTVERLGPDKVFTANWSWTNETGLSVFEPAVTVTGFAGEKPFEVVHGQKVAPATGRPPGY